MIMFIASMLSGAVGAMGIGGGVILIPVLTTFFDISQKSAQFINLVYFIPVALCAIIVHWKEKRLDFRTALIMIISGIPGALIGAEIAAIIDVDILRKIFGFFLLATGIKQLK